MTCVVPPNGCVEITQNLLNAPSLCYGLFLLDPASNECSFSCSVQFLANDDDDEATNDEATGDLYRGYYRILDIGHNLDTTAAGVASGIQISAGAYAILPKSNLCIAIETRPSRLRNETILQHQDDAPGFETTSIKLSLTHLCKGYDFRGSPKFAAF